MVERDIARGFYTDVEAFRLFIHAAAEKLRLAAAFAALTARTAFSRQKCWACGLP
jgi:hypothetical protein